MGAVDWRASVALDTAAGRDPRAADCFWAVPLASGSWGSLLANVRPWLIHVGAGEVEADDDKEEVEAEDDKEEGARG